MGDIGKPERRVTFEPIETPVPVAVPVTEPAREPEKVPA